MKRIITLAIFSFIANVAFAQVKPVKEVNWSSFSGTWYLITRLPNELDKDLKNVNVTYSYVPKKEKIKETFAGTNQKGKKIKIKSTLKVKEPGIFTGPFGKEYYVIMVGPGYEYAAVATPDMKNLFVMSRKKSMDNNTYNKILSDLVSMKFEPTQLVMMPQE